MADEIPTKRARGERGDAARTAAPHTEDHRTSDAEVSIAHAVHRNLVAANLGANVPERRIRTVLDLFDSGATVPFVARYRKEATGGLDEVALINIRDEAARVSQLIKRREAIVKSLDERNLFKGELRSTVEGATTMQALEDAYLPHRPKKRTRATIAAERGLRPLADAISALIKDGGLDAFSRNDAANPNNFVSKEKEVPTWEDAIAGASDILAEDISTEAAVRELVRNIPHTIKSTVIKTKQSEPGASKFRDYFDREERLSRVPGHRLLAMLRGKAEGFLRLGTAFDTEATEKRIFHLLYKDHGEELYKKRPHRFFPFGVFRDAVNDSLKRLIAPSVETELMSAAKDRADQEAIAVFSKNTRELLLASPVGTKAVIAVDPGIRTGAKVVALSDSGAFLEYKNLFMVGSSEGSAGRTTAATEMKRMVSAHRPAYVAVGSGTASRETVAFIEGLKLGVGTVTVDETGASVYSASEIARKEFPDLDVTVRGAISIGRRMQDPLAELVKIDPKAIGVGQYQHDVNQPSLKQSLEDTVVSCVNAVGVHLNTASAELLRYVAGVGPQLAQAIVDHRSSIGGFSTRLQLRDVPRLGPKKFEQAAGFLRVQSGTNPLDATGVHPESYDVVDAMAKSVGCSVAEFISSADKRARLDTVEFLANGLPKSALKRGVGRETVKDILSEVASPGRDPRPPFEEMKFADAIKGINDLVKGDELPGVVTNVTKFGAFVNLGIKEEGLVHVSQMRAALGGQRIDDPTSVLRVKQRITVEVIEVDQQRKRIGLRLVKV